MKILAIETSCDETAAAIVEDGTKILGSAVASSTAMHEKYGGIVPEVAAREQLKCILPVLNEALAGAGLTFQSINKLAVTIGPGLIGSLLVGVETAKTLAYVLNKPIIPVNHVLAHMYANFIGSPKIEFPAISLVASGGHTELYLMKSVKDLRWLGGTLDDAAGEAFDKTARLLGFGSRGGLAVQEAAELAKKTKTKFEIRLPRPMTHDNSLNFSFSGLKTAVLREVNKLREEKQFNSPIINYLAYEVEEAITDVLVSKTLQAVRQFNAKSILISGGVASNTRLREKFSSSVKNELKFHFPTANLCTDNAAYIASYAYFHDKATDWHTLDACPDLSVEVGLS